MLGLLDKLRVERGSHDSHIYMVAWVTNDPSLACTLLLALWSLKTSQPQSDENRDWESTNPVTMRKFVQVTEKASCRLVSP